MEPADPPVTERRIEWGWMLSARLDAEQRAACEQARRAVLDELGRLFPGFAWSAPVVRVELPENGEEASLCLTEAAQERETRAWDFALVLTAADLRSYYKSYALAVPSRSLAVAVLSLARLDPMRDGGLDRLSGRVHALALHLFGDLSGLWHREDAELVMAPPRSVEDLDRARRFEDGERAVLGGALEEVADLRLEEIEHPPRGLPFYLRAVRERAGEIRSAVLQARPWEFPLRLSRLTTAAASALFVLVVTAEVWDLGTSLAPMKVVGLSLASLVVTTVFVLERQKLLLRRARRRLSEQAVVSNVSATLVVGLGLISTYAALFLLTLLIGGLFFGPELLARWAPNAAEQSGARTLTAMGGLVASLGLLVGALGASFEGNHYFRHVIYADEET